jgi:hypothetical protein
MSESTPDADPHFLQLVLMFQGAAYQHMGKIMNPATQKVERDLEQARNAIDLLSMLDTKTKGNLTGDESALLEHTLYELRMNYVDEANKGETVPEESTEDAPTDGAPSDVSQDGGDEPESPEAEADDSEES